jgi:predicted acylesterase/phospholipase RssA
MPAGTSLRTALCIALLLGGFPPLPLLARQDAPEPTPVILALASGVSEGAYQAGAAWAILAALRSAPSLPTAPGRSAPAFDLVALAGSSAGSVNAVISTLEWCRADDRPLPPEQSLFWRTWTRVGWEQLFPRDYRHYQEAIFHRAYFNERLYPELLQAMQAPQRSDCRVLLGVPVTKLRPSHVALTDGLAVPTQRHVVAFVAQTDGAEDTRPLRLVAPSPAMATSAAVGRLLLLPESHEKDPRGRIEPQSVFALLEAASAFPAVFGVRLLEYVDPLDQYDACAGESGTGCVRVEPFVDGAIFDRGPLSLAFALLDVLELESRSPLVIYIDAEQTRGHVIRSTIWESQVGSQRGLHALHELARGAWPATRGYELHMFARELARHPLDRAALRVTARSFPIFGEQLFKMGGFLGRPFREHDFYVGVYDGLTLVTEILCRLGAETTCSDRVFADLVAAEATHVPAYWQGVLRALRDLERGGELTLPAATTDKEDVLNRLLLSGTVLLDAAPPPSCARATYAATLLCLQGFDRRLEAFATAEVRAWAKQWADRPQCHPAQFLTAPDECEADRTFAAFLANPQLHVHRLIELALERARLVEVQLAREGRPHRLAITEITQMLYHSSPGRYKRRFEVNTSTIPDHARRSARIMRLLPYSAAVTLGGSGWELAWQPVLRFADDGTSRRLTEGLRLKYGLLRYPADETRTGHIFFGSVGQLLDLDSFILSSADVGVEYSRTWGGGGRPALTGGVQALGGKLRLGGRWFFDGNDTQYQNGSDVGVSIGVADVNGLAYWTGRSVRHRLQARALQRPRAAVHD